MLVSLSSVNRFMFSTSRNTLSKWLLIIQDGLILVIIV